MKFKEKNVCFAVAVALLALTLWFTSCGVATAEAGADNKPCYHITVYSPAIDQGRYGGRRYAKYSVTTDNINDIFQSLGTLHDYEMIRIPRGNGRFDLVHVSLVAIES